MAEQYRQRAEANTILQMTRKDMRKNLVTQFETAKMELAILNGSANSLAFPNTPPVRTPRRATFRPHPISRTPKTPGVASTTLHPPPTPRTAGTPMMSVYELEGKMVNLTMNANSPDDDLTMASSVQKLIDFATADLEAIRVFLRIRTVADVRNYEVKECKRILNDLRTGGFLLNPKVPKNTKIKTSHLTKPRLQTQIIDLLQVPVN